MFKALLKKQFAELKASYFTNKKTGKARSGSGAVWLIILLAFLLVSLAAGFFGISMLFADAFFYTGLDWLYFALIGMMSIAIGTIGSVFSTYAGLYHAKDNEALLSMPIPPGMILACRMIPIYFMALVFSGVAWVPSIVVYCLEGSAAPLAVVLDVLLTFVIALFVTVLSCILGWVVALISGRLKNKSIITVLITVALLGAYYYFYSQINVYLAKLAENGEKVGAAIRTKVYPIYQLGLGATGKTVPMLIFTAITVAAFAVCVIILAATFTRIVTSAKGGSKAVYKKKEAKASSTSKALFTKELRKFVSSPTYMLNTGLGLIILPALAIFALIKSSAMNDVISMFASESPTLGRLIPVVFAAMIILIISMNAITAPSVSIEGRTIWQLQSLPVEPRDVLRAKEKMHVVLNLVPAVVSTVLVGLAIKADVLTIISMLFVVCAFIWLTGTAGLALNLKKPVLDWTNEAVPVKQSVSALIVIFGGWAVAVVFGGAAFLLGRFVPAWAYMFAFGAVFFVVSWLIRRWNDTKGAEIFATLA